MIQLEESFRNDFELSEEGPRTVPQSGNTDEYVLVQRTTEVKENEAVQNMATSC